MPLHGQHRKRCTSVGEIDEQSMMSTHAAYRIVGNHRAYRVVTHSADQSLFCTCCVLQSTTLIAGMP
ncbi:hypothetical protein [Novipirellula rosea]|uniref:hypothetical protein n=1 Tax=Novipirellula rosea TaxID=1031540 RepID=UPI0030EE1A58